MSRWIIPLLLASTLGASAAEVGFRHWRMEPSGHLAVGDGSSRGTRLDVHDDLGYGGAEPVTGFDIVVGREHQLAIDWMAVDASGSATTSHPIKFSDLTFPAGLPLRSTFDGELVRVAYRYVTGSEQIRGGFLAGLEFVDVETEASALGVGATRESITAAMPVIGGVLEASPTPYLSAQLALTGGSWTWTDVSATLLDAEASLRLRLEHFYAGTGYRYLRMDGDDDTVPLQADIRLSGPVLFAGFAF